MADDSDPESKTEEATAGKLSKAREQGDVPKTPDLPLLASFAAAASVIAFAGGAMCRDLALAMMPFIAHPDSISVSGGGSQEVLYYVMKAGAPLILGVMFAAALAGAAGNLVQTGLMFTPSKVFKFDYKKISPMAGLKRMFGVDALMQFAKSLVKIGLVGWIGYLVVKPHMAEFTQLSAMDPNAILPFAARLIRALAFSIAGFLLLIAGLDWFWQKQRFMKRQRMSKEDLKEEYKQTEGDPHIKGKQKQLRMVRARQRMMQNVPGATVVVMNPTHYAVALKYEAGGQGAPQCVAKGMDAIALRIRKVAEEAGVPVIVDPPLARSLYASVEIEEFIPQNHYEAVAKIIGFIMQNEKRAEAPPPKPKMAPTRVRVSG
ncbi:MAG: flagellar biosynthesis protein FlhB [Phenylobacterium sp.]|uniref:flagellar biosynthesis protein FlhB n=1 Tax=Phenylobacterium sp. TaxID=1871053 RepID=UPI002719997F|nr:flagellar biosynthesis protein FlhB [Phenylobacterium sp.]MDO8913814.1 flagellar biosynthesis protein FlhB [Phenylobacterium sp.]MDP3100503.1 flagellar biosynthesis protein FlhB [Phenylobacterium sp.]MDP3635742.1 flagellar biosynthesis protein FlhB [Phenylobacterium sp.]MDP3869883.1 flagellar biosynthesis protein FlhB [Phenylobacterium sp.]